MADRAAGELLFQRCNGRLAQVCVILYAELFEIFEVIKLLEVCVGQADLIHPQSFKICEPADGGDASKLIAADIKLGKPGKILKRRDRFYPVAGKIEVLKLRHAHKRTYIAYAVV